MWESGSKGTERWVVKGVMMRRGLGIRGRNGGIRKKKKGKKVSIIRLYYSGMKVRRGGGT